MPPILTLIPIVVQLTNEIMRQVQLAKAANEITQEQYDDILAAFNLSNQAWDDAVAAAKARLGID